MIAFTSQTLALCTYKSVFRQTALVLKQLWVNYNTKSQQKHFLWSNQIVWLLRTAVDQWDLRVHRLSTLQFPQIEHLNSFAVRQAIWVTEKRQQATRFIIHNQCSGTEEHLKWYVDVRIIIVQCTLSLDKHFTRPMICVIDRKWMFSPDFIINR